jgi:hypothetical protein
MNKVATWMVAAAMTGIGSAAAAQDVQFYVDGQIQNNNGSFAGEVTINPTTGTFDSGSITISGLSNPNVPNLLQLDTTYNFVVNYAVVGYGQNMKAEELTLSAQAQPFSGPEMHLYVPGATLVGFSGAQLLDTNDLSNASGSNTAVYLSGQISLTSSAPEIDPASAASGLTLLLGSLLVLRGRRSGAALAA